MALPPQIQTVTVSFGPFLDFQGIPLAGSTRFTPSTPVNHAATGTPILNRPINVAWDEDGRGILVLPATDSVGLDVTGFTYRVQHTFSDGAVPAPPSNSIQLPAAVPSVDLDLLIPVPAQNGVVVSVPGVTSVVGKAGSVTGADIAAAPEVRAASVSAVQAAIADGTIVAGSGPAPALSIMRAGLTSRLTTPFRKVDLGSSTTAGSQATAPANRYVNRLAARFQAAYPSGTGSEVGVIASTTCDFGTLATSPGVHVYNGGEGGTNSATFLTAAEAVKVGALGARMVQIMIGSNDYDTGMAIATYKANVELALSRLRAAQTGGPCVYVLVHAYQRYDTRAASGPAWSEYGQALAQITAAAPADVAFVDLSKQYAAIGIPSTDPLGYMGTDKVHMVDGGHAFMAALLADAYGIPVVVAATSGPADTSKPTAPTGLTAGTPTSASVPLSWTAATDNVAVTGYRVYRGTTLVVSGVTGTSYTVTGLTPATAYSFTVTALDAAGNESDPSTAATATTGAAPGGLATYTSDGFSTAGTTLVGKSTDAAGGGTAKAYETSTTDAALAVSSGTLRRGGTVAAQFAAIAMPAADQSLACKVTVAPTAADLFIVIRRQALTSSASYRAKVGVSGSVTLQRTDSAGAATDLGPTTTYATGDTVEARATGTTVGLYKNGTLVGEVTDSNVSGAGYAGVAVGSATASFQLDDALWKAVA